jgi:beta-lactamase class A
MPSLTRRALLSAAAPASLAAMGHGTTAQTWKGLAELEAATGGRIGVAGLNTANGRTVEHRADQRFPFCSTFKLITASAILQRSVTDPELLGRRIDYGKQDLVPYSPITSQHAGQGMTVSAICAAALQYSDNTAANLMIRLLGGTGAVTDFARSIGDERFRLDRWETALNDAVPGDPRDTSTPAAMLADLRLATLGGFLPAPRRAQLVTWMKGCTTGFKRIRAALPAGWIVADKTGTGDYGTANDIAVVWPPGRPPIILAVYTTQEKQNAPSNDATVAAAARLALQALG